MAIRFNGTSDYAATASALTLSGYSTGTLAFRLWYDAYPGADGLALEMSANANGGVGCLYIDPDSTDIAGKWVIGRHMTGGFASSYINRPSAAAWHDIAVLIDWTADPSVIKIYVDGSDAGAVNTGAAGTALGAFSDQVWYFASRGGSSLFAGMRLEDLAIWGGHLLSPSDVAAVHAGRAAGASVTPTFYWPLVSDGTATQGGVNLVLHGTTVVPGPHAPVGSGTPPGIVIGGHHGMHYVSPGIRPIVIGGSIRRGRGTAIQFS
jgi:hypothetical protein